MLVSILLVIRTILYRMGFITPKAYAGYEVRELGRLIYDAEKELIAAKYSRDYLVARRAALIAEHGFGVIPPMESKLPEPSRFPPMPSGPVDSWLRQEQRRRDNEGETEARAIISQFDKGSRL
jgi:hypothetical protein